MVQNVDPKDDCHCMHVSPQIGFVIVSYITSILTSFDNDAYVQPLLPFIGTNALPREDDSTITATCEAIVVGLIP